MKSALAVDDFKRAERYLDQLLGRYPKNIELLSMRARVLAWQKRYQESLDVYKQALALKPDVGLKRELHKVEVEFAIAKANRLLSHKDIARAEYILRELFDGNRERYESGLLLARLYYDSGRHGKAVNVLEQMLKEFPRERDLVPLYGQALLGKGETERVLLFLQQTPASEQNSVLLAIRGRALFRLKRFAEAAASFSRSIALTDDPNVRIELERAKNSDELETAVRYIAEGRNDAAATLLETLFNSCRNRYDSGIRLAGILTRSGKFEETAKIYNTLMQEYPDEREIPLLYAKTLINLNRYDLALDVLNGIKNRQDAGIYALRGRIFFLRHQLGLAKAEYVKALQLTNMPEVIAENSEVEAAIRFDLAKKFVETQQYRQAEPLLRKLTETGSYSYESRLLIGRIYLAEQEYERAADHYRQLQSDYPTDSDIAALWVESLILAGKSWQGGGILYKLNPQVHDALFKEREDLFYRVNTNWVRLSGDAYSYSNGSKDETGAAVTVSQRFQQFTFVSTASETTRYGSTDPQFGLDVYVGKEERSKLSGVLSLSASPGAQFLPVTTIGGELSRGVSSFELSAGYNRLDFKNSGVNIVTAGALWYIPASTLSLYEKAYIVPENGTVMFVTTLNWEPNHRVRSFIAMGAGNSSEKISSTQDVARYASYFVRVGTEHRFTPSYSIGAEGSFESRIGLYDRSGAQIYARYWWR